jgi:hypothetical protein
MPPTRREKLQCKVEVLEARIAPAAGVVPLSILNGTNGFKVIGETAGDRFGDSVSDAGDLNGDGFADLIIGAPSADPNGSNSGAIYVVFGKAGAFDATWAAADLDGTNGFKISGVAAVDLAGGSVSSAGDVNGDGYGDLVVGAWAADPGNRDSAGASYVVFGKKSGWAANVNLSGLNGSDGFKISGAARGDGAGRSVSSAGDFNGDGFDDLIIGAPSGSPLLSLPSGAAFLVFGKSGAFEPNLELSLLNGTNGFRLTGAAPGDQTGVSVSGAGDVNGDGLADIIIGAIHADVNGSDSGAGYVVFGRTTAPGANLDLAALDGTNGFRLAGAVSFDRAGMSVSGAGDFNGDGFDDMIIGANYASANGARSGASYVVFGRGSGFASNINLSALNGSNGFKLSGVAADDHSGRPVSGAGDVNGDGYDDLIIGAFRADPNGLSSGSSYLVYGKASGFSANFNLSSLNGTNGYRLDGLSAGDSAGYSVSGAGDLNKDGFADLIIGATQSINDQAGVSYIIFGNASGFIPAISVSDVTVVEPVSGSATASFRVTLSSATTEAVTVQYATSDGTAISGADFTAADVAMLTFAPGETTKTVSVAVHADAVREVQETFLLNLSNPTNSTLADAQGVGTIFDRTAVFELSGLSGGNGFTITGSAADDFAGTSVSSAGDVNGDGYDDVIIGAPRADANGTDSGAAYVVFGKAGGFSQILNLAALDGSNGFKLSGISPIDTAGVSVSAAGDVNGDGFDDVIVGAPYANRYSTQSGSSYIVFGRRSGFAANLNLSALDGTNGFRIDGAEIFDRIGQAVGAAGDVNGDGFDDVIVGSRIPSPNGSFSGASYVLFGKAVFESLVDLATLDGTNGFKLSGVAERDYSGSSVSTAGDVNGDGFADLIVGAPGADPNGANSGAGYVIFGKASGFTANLNLSALDGNNGFKISGVAPEDRAGAASAAGDVNGDGFADLIIGASRADANGADSGASYVLFGKATGFTANVNLSALDGGNGFKISGVSAEDFSGISVSGAGDVNGDGIDDLIIGAYGLDGSIAGSGGAYIVFGTRSGFPADLNLATLDGSTGFKLHGPSPGGAGRAVSAAGDVNGDGFDDVIMGARFASPNGASSGAAYVVFGSGTEIRVGNAAVFEGNHGTTAIEFRVTLSETSFIPVSVRLSTSSGSALAGEDFLPIDDLILTFAPGETSKTVSVILQGDPLHERDETFSLVLSEATGAVIRDGTGSGTILNDDPAPVVSVVGGSIAEGNSGTRQSLFTVSLSAPSTLPVSVDFSTADGTAVAGIDYTAKGLATLTFAPGETSKTVSVDVLGDLLFEADESFALLLSNAVGGIVANPIATVTIQNDDAAPKLIITGDSGLEGDSGLGNLIFTVSLSAASGVPVLLTYATVDGTALGGEDYLALLPDTLVFNPGETTKTIAVQVLGDQISEDHEQFSVVLSGAIGADVEVATATGSILNDDASLSITHASILEGHSGVRVLEFTVSLDAASALPVTVAYATADRTAVAGSDYIGSEGSLVFDAGVTTRTILVEVLGDTEAELTSENFSLNLLSALNATIVQAAGMGTILDDDVSLLGKRKAQFTSPDGDPVTIRVSKGTLHVEDFTLFPAGNGSQLGLVDFREKAEFNGTNFSITAKRAPGTAAGPRTVDVGFIDATGIDLGKVVIGGDLGRVASGSALDSKPALQSLNAKSLGFRGLETQLEGGSLRSELAGTLKAIKLGRMDGAMLSVSGDIGKLSVKGSVLASQIQSDGRIHSIRVGGDLAGGAAGDAILSALGTLDPASNSRAIALGAISIGGSVDHAHILAGYDRAGAAVNSAVRIGPVRVGTNWIAANLVAGAIAGSDALFGTEDDALISRKSAIVASIASVIIRGEASGGATGEDRCGIVGGEIRSLQVGLTKIELTTGAGNDLLGKAIDSIGAVIVREVA